MTFWEQSNSIIILIFRSSTPLNFFLILSLATLLFDNTIYKCFHFNQLFTTEIKPYFTFWEKKISLDINKQKSISSKHFLPLPKLDVQSCTLSCYVRCATLIVWVGGMPWPTRGVNHYHAHSGLPEKGRTNKGCSVVRIYEGDGF